MRCRSRGHRKISRDDELPLHLVVCDELAMYLAAEDRKHQREFIKQLRAVREAWLHAQILARSRDATQRALAAAVERTANLECDGIGHVTASDRYYALAEHARERERRRIGREECCGEPTRAITARRRATGEPPVGEDESDREAVRLLAIAIRSGLLFPRADGRPWRSHDWKELDPACLARRSASYRRLYRDQQSAPATSSGPPHSRQDR